MPSAGPPFGAPSPTVPQSPWSPTEALSVRPLSPGATAFAETKPASSAATAHDSPEAPQSATPNPPEKSVPAQGIAVRIARPEAPSVDVFMTERAGQVHVAVRTSDTLLQTSLRQELGALVRSLERSGFQTETFMPSPAPRLSSAAPAAGASFNGDASGFGRRDEPRGGSQRQPRHKNRTPIVLEEIEPMEHAA